MKPVSTEDRKETHPPFCLHAVADLECTVLTSKGVDRNRKGLFDTFPLGEFNCSIESKCCTLENVSSVV